jgi:HSP20 family protein
MSTKSSLRKRGDSTEIAPSSGASLTTPAAQTGLWRGFDAIFEDFRRSFDELMRPFFPFASNWSTQLDQEPIRYPFIDVVDHGEYYSVVAELPGFSKEQVDVRVNNSQLYLKAEKKTQTEEKQHNYLHHERVYSTFERTVAFPEEVIPSQVEGTMKDGLLELRIPKKEPRPEEKMTKVQLK